MQASNSRLPANNRTTQATQSKPEQSRTLSPGAYKSRLFLMAFFFFKGLIVGQPAGKSPAKPEPFRTYIALQWASDQKRRV